MTLIYWLRLLCLLAKQWFARPIPFEQPLTLNFRVKLTDCDGIRFMCAPIYFIYMDLGRWALILRTGLAKPALKKGWHPFLGGQKIIYKKPLKRGTKFQLTVSYAGWDEKWCYNLHVFKQNGTVMAIGVTRGALWHKGSHIRPKDGFSVLGRGEIEKTAPEWILRMFEGDSDVLKLDLN